MFIVELIDNEIRIGNKFFFVGNDLVEDISARGIVSKNYRKIDMLKIKDFYFVEPYYVALSLIGMSKSDIDKNMVSGKLSLTDSKGFVFGSQIKIRSNQTPAFLDPSLYQALSFIEVVFSEQDEERRFFFFDVDVNDLSSIDFFKYNKNPLNSDRKLVSSSESSSFTTLTSIRDRINGNKLYFLISNSIFFAITPLILFYIGVINTPAIVFFISFFAFNISSFFLLSSASSSKFLLLNPFVSYFCLSKKEFLSIIKRGN